MIKELPGIVNSKYSKPMTSTRRKISFLCRALSVDPGYDLKDMKKAYSVYILICRDGTFYTGIAKSVADRLGKHNSGRGAKYTRTRTPCTLVYQEKGFLIGDALKRERAIKKMSRLQKRKLWE